MTSDRIRSHVERLLTEADGALIDLDWEQVKVKAEAALRLDPNNADALGLLAAANRDAVFAPAAEHQSPPTGSVPSNAPQPTSFANGRYTVSKFLGEGGKKKVYLAHDSLLDRDVAFALIKTEGLDEASRTRITREGQAMGRLGDHPNIVTVYDIGEENGAPYMVLPVLAGGDVEGVIEKAPEHRMPLERALQIAIETCKGLEFAHRRGIVHRDLKPGNVWLSEDGTAKIGDFGLAVAMDKSRLTQAGMMVGTVSYMPPEQAMGGDVGPRSDLYSLGAMLYEMVCGRPPFVGDESVAIIGQHLNTPPVAPTWHRPDCPAALEALVLRLLEKDPSRRPASAAAVREALEGVRSGMARPRDPAIAAEAPAGGDNPLYRRTFVGRENEVKQLQAAFDVALSGQGGLVMVVGEPGIGKTALCEQLATYVALRGGKALVGHCYEEGSLSLPYLAFVEAMRSYVLAREPDGLRSDLGTGAADVARIVSEVRDRVQGVELRLNGDPEDDRWRLLQAVTSFLRNASAVQPLVIVVEDLHWADRGTLDLLLHVSRNLEGTRLLIVGTYRDVEVDRSHPLSNVMGDLRRLNSFQRVPLRGLTAEEVQRMMAAVAQREIPWPLAELLHRQTEGSPLFVQEMLRYLVEEGLVSDQAGQIRRVGDAPLAGRIPEGLRDVIGKRLTRLGPDANRLLAIASVIGRDFRLDVLQLVAAMSEDTVIAALEEAKSAAVVEEHASVGAVVTYRFSHAFFSQTLYEEISAPRRIRLHQQVGRALEDVFARRLDEHASELAEHFSHSSDAADLAKAVQYGELAAGRALGVFDYGEAARLLERATEVQEVLDPDDKGKRCDLLLELAQALVPSGEVRRVKDQIAPEAFSLAESISDGDRVARVCSIALNALWRYGAIGTAGTKEGADWAERADRFGQDGTGARVEADVALALSALYTGRHDEALSRAHAALALARNISNSDRLFWAANSLAWCLPTYSTERLELVEEFLRAPREGVNSHTLAQLLIAGGDTYLSLCNREKADEAWQQAAAVASRSLDAYTLLLSHLNEIKLATLNGDLENAEGLVLALAAQSDEDGASPAASRLAHVWGLRSLLYLGRAGKLLTFRERPDSLIGLSAQFFRDALCLRSMGALEDAKKAFDRGMGEIAKLGGARSLTNINLVTLLEAAIALEDRDVVTSLRPFLPDRADYLSGLTCTGRHLGDASALLDRPDEALGYYDQALEVCQRVRFRPELALTRLGLAELLLEHYPDERDAAIEHLDFAIAELRDMKMQPALERALRHRGLLKA